MNSAAKMSPCISQCCLNDEDICVGCFRSMDEILMWAKVDDEARRQILINVKQRQNENTLAKE